MTGQSHRATRAAGWLGKTQRQRLNALRVNRARIVKQERCILAQFAVLYSAGREPETIHDWRARFVGDVERRMTRKMPTLGTSEAIARAADIALHGERSSFWVVRDSVWQGAGEGRTIRAALHKIMARLGRIERGKGTRYAAVCAERERADRAAIYAEIDRLCALLT